MRDFLEDLGKRLGETAETMTNKAGEAIEIQKLKGQIRGLARGNAVDLLELGRTIYDRYKNGEEVDENSQALCEAVQNREQSIEGYEKKIARLRGASECSRCGRMVAKDMVFCPYCGEKIETSVYEEEEETDYADAVKEKVADATEKAAGKADEAAKKTADFADEAAKKTADFAEKAAKKTGDMAEKAAQKVSEAAEKAADKLSEAADKMKKDPENPE